MRDLQPLPCRPMIGDVLAGLSISLIGSAVALALWLATFHAAAAQVGPELIVRACDVDRPGVCLTRTFPVCDVEAATETLAAEGYVVRMAACLPAQREV